MPSKIVAPTGNPVLDSLIIEHAWGGQTITYSFGFSDIDGNQIPDMEQGDWKAFHRELIGNVETFTGLKFSEIAEHGNINFKLEQGGGGFSGVPGPGTDSVDTVVGIDPNVTGAAEVVRLGTFSVTWFHELGHALGLSHTHDQTSTPKLPGVVEPGDFGTGSLNSHLYTVMGYTYHFLGEDNPFTTVVDPNATLNAQSGSFGAIDIAALQHMYGRSSHNAGNDLYRFSDDVDFNRGYSTIWDTGGIDTIAYTGSGRAKIDLREATLKAEIGGGGWVSTSQTLTGGFTIANGVVIENAIGGDADDIIVGNIVANVLKGLAGDDHFTGHGGRDTIEGGIGFDTAVFDGSRSSFTILRTSTTEVSVTNSQGETSKLTDVERFTFDDGSVELKDLTLPTAPPPSPEPLPPTVPTPPATPATPNPSAGPLVGGTVGNDVLSGRSGTDNTILAGKGNDTVNAGSGNDTVFGNQDDDLLFGNQGADRLFGGQGNDEVYGGQGDDVAQGNLGDDRLFGNLGNDTLFGNEGTDFIHGGQGEDQLLGGQGSDALNGGVGNDVLFGGLESDTFVFTPGQGNDTVGDFSRAQGDVLDLQGQSVTSVTSNGDGDAILALSGGGTITLLGMTADEFALAA